MPRFHIQALLGIFIFTLFLQGTVEATTIADFDALTPTNQQAFIYLLILSAKAHVRLHGTDEDSKRVGDLFFPQKDQPDSPDSGAAMNELNANLAQARQTNDQNASNPASKPLELEDVFHQTLAQNGVNIPSSFLFLSGKSALHTLQKKNP